MFAGAQLSRNRSCPGFPQCWGENLLLLADPFQLMSTQVLHLHATCKGKAGRRYELTTKFARQLFQSRRMIDGGADHGEVEAIGSTNVPVADFTEMQCQPEANLGLTRISARQVALRDLRPHDHGRAQ